MKTTQMKTMNLKTAEWCISQSVTLLTKAELMTARTDYEKANIYIDIAKVYADLSDLVSTSVSYTKIAENKDE